MQDAAPQGGQARLAGFGLAFWLFGAVVATFFTNLEPVPLCVALAPLCNAVLVESVARVFTFLALQLPIGLALGASTFGYLGPPAVAIALLLQLVMAGAFLVHRVLRRRHPEACATTLALPCLLTAAYALSMTFLPIGATGHPAYSATRSQVLMQLCALTGRSGVAFLFLWSAAAGAGAILDTREGGAGRTSGRICAWVWIAVMLAGGLRLHWPQLFRDIQDWDGTIDGADGGTGHQVSCLTQGGHIFEQTRARLVAGDTIVIHSERYTSAGRAETSEFVSRYAALLEDNYNSTSTEALLVLSFVDEGRSWYHLVDRSGAKMSYAKNHPVPFVEDDILAGEALPSVVEVTFGREDRRTTISISGSVCFDTDFPALTRAVAGADLFLETSDTWFNIGEAHFQGHLLAAVENGATLVKCTHNGVTGAFDPRGNVLFKVPQSEGTVVFTLPRFHGAVSFPRVAMAFDVIVSFAACGWLLLAAVPSWSSRLLGPAAAEAPPGRDAQI